MASSLLQRLFRIRHNTHGEDYQGENVMVEGYVNTKEAADKWHVSEVYIRMLVREGRVKGQKIRRDWIVESASLEKYMTGDRKRGPKTS